MQWWQWLLIVVGVLAVVFLILMQTSWFKVRAYAAKVKQAFDKHKLEEKAQAVQALGEHPNPVLAKKPLRELTGAYQGLIADLEKIKAPAKVQELHQETLEFHRESLRFYQMGLTGGMRQKSMMEKQRKLMRMERSLTEKMEKVYGPMEKEKKKK